MAQERCESNGGDDLLRKVIRKARLRNSASAGVARWGGRNSRLVLNRTDDLDEFIFD